MTVDSAATAGNGRGEPESLDLAGSLRTPLIRAGQLMGGTASQRLQDLQTSVAGALLRTHWLARTPIWLYRARLGVLFGRRAQWLPNVLKNPQVRVYIAGHRAAPAFATLLDPEQAATALRRYAGAHPRAWQRLKPVFEQTLGAPIGETGTTLPLVRLAADLPNGGTHSGREGRRADRT